MFPNHALIKTDAYAMVAARAVSAFVDGVLMHPGCRRLRNNCFPVHPTLFLLTCLDAYYPRNTMYNF